MSNVGAAMNGRRFSSRVLPSGQNARAAASLARVCSIAHAGELVPGGGSLSAVHAAGSAHMSAGTASFRCAHGSVGGSFSSNRPNVVARP
jgi:hypothetical protein